jgi:hypothetical protein
VARGFQRSRRGEIRARLDVHERGILSHLFTEVHDLLDAGGSSPDTDPLAAMVGIGTATEAPADPALARLLPDAHRDDADASADFRRYTEVGLRDRKRSGLETARRTLAREGALVLDDAEAQAWVVALTDVRLVLAERLGLRTDDDHDRLIAELQDLDAAAADDESASERAQNLDTMLALYDWLTWLQDGLVVALMAHLDADPPGR